MGTIVPKKRVGLIWAIGAVIAVTIFLVVNQDNLRPKQFAVVERGKLYRSAALTPAMLRRVAEQHGIKTVIDLGATEPNTWEEAHAQRTTDSLHLTRYVFDLEGDATGNPNAYVQALRLIDDPKNQPVLVHCSAGAQRTGCLVGMYRVIEQGVSVDQAMVEANRFRAKPEKNPHLEGMLRTWVEPVRDALNAGGQIGGQPALPEPKPHGG